jgi:hypothetical protein
MEHASSQADCLQREKSARDPCWVTRHRMNQLNDMPVSQETILGVGKALGRREAFGLVAGRCSAADAACLRQIRTSKEYLAVEPTWNDFCSKRLNMGKTTVDRIIALLDEFGPTYFELAQLTRISPETYRSIAPSIDEEGVHLQGGAIEIVSENAARLSAAVAELRKAALPAAVSTADRLHSLDKRCRHVVGEFTQLAESGPGEEERGTLLTTLGEVQASLAQIELRLKAA